MTYDPEKLTMLLVKHHWKKQLFTWAAQSSEALLDQGAREHGGQFDWWNRGPDSGEPWPPADPLPAETLRAGEVLRGPLDVAVDEHGAAWENPFDAPAPGEE